MAEKAAKSARNRSGRSCRKAASAARLALSKRPSMICMGSTFAVFKMCFSVRWPAVAYGCCRRIIPASRSPRNIPQARLPVWSRAAAICTMYRRMMRLSAMTRQTTAPGRSPSRCFATPFLPMAAGSITARTGALTAGMVLTAARARRFPSWCAMVCTLPRITCCAFGLLIFPLYSLAAPSIPIGTAANASWQ